jgi:nickel/cobalt exporter
MRRARLSILFLACPALVIWLACGTLAHPLGNFTINHFARIEAQQSRVHLRYVIDMAEISTLQELQSAGVRDANSPSAEELDSYLARVAAEYPAGLALAVDGSPVVLKCVSKRLSMPEGAGGLKTMRTELDYEGDLPDTFGAQVHSLHFEDTNHSNRIGWHELVVAAGRGVAIFNSSAYGSAVTDELKAYPQDALAAPLNERAANLSFAAGTAPAGAKGLQARDGAKIVQTRDRLAELITVPHLTPLAALLGLLLAAALGGMHAMSPGHGKTVVGAYLVGSRGSARHAAFLGLTVTITHTAGVFALGLVTLLASRYVLPERLFPILSFVSGAMVAVIGLSLFLRRLRALRSARTREFTHSDAPGHSQADMHSHPHSHAHSHSEMHSHTHALEHSHSHHYDHSDDLPVDSHSESQPPHTALNHASHHDSDHTHHHHAEDGHGHGHHHHNVVDAGHNHSHDHGADHDHDETGHVHSHGGVTHSHLPPGADGSPITWRGLLGLGISGGLLPCPSALVVLLAAISLHRVGYGLVLVIAFSAGLAGVLTSVGLVFVYAGRLMKSVGRGRIGRLGQVIPVFSAFVITLAGSAICIEALGQAGFHLGSIIARLGPPPPVPLVGSVGALGIALCVGLVYGIRRAQHR